LTSNIGIVLVISYGATTYNLIFDTNSFEQITLKDSCSYDISITGFVVSGDELNSSYLTEDDENILLEDGVGLLLLESSL
jgi:hypothetical protein